MFEVHFGRKHYIGAGFWIGVGFLVLAASLYAKAVADEHARNWEPLALPVSLTQGTIKTPELGNDLDGDYDILIELEKKIDFHRMECLLGTLETNGMRPVWCHGIPDLIDISWTLFEGNNAVSEGNSGRYPGGVWSAKVERHMGRFTAQKGHSYTLILNVKRNASELNIANPKLVVMVPRADGEGYGAAIAVEKLGATILALIGGIIVLGKL